MGQPRRWLRSLIALGVVLFIGAPLALVFGWYAQIHSGGGDVRYCFLGVTYHRVELPEPVRAGLLELARLDPSTRLRWRTVKVGPENPEYNPDAGWQVAYWQTGAWLAVSPEIAQRLLAELDSSPTDSVYPPFSPLRGGLSGPLFLSDEGECYVRPGWRAFEEVQEFLRADGGAVRRGKGEPSLHSRDDKLHEAARLGDAASVAEFLSGGSDPDVPDAYGWTPLHWACDGGQDKVVELLLSAGAATGIPNVAGRTALHLGAEGGHIGAVRLLCAAGAPVDSTCPGGWTALHLASAAGQEEVVRFLVQAGSDVGAADDRGDTPLHWAASGGVTTCVRALLDAGSDPNAGDLSGQTPLDLALLHHHDEAASVLAEHGGKESPEDAGAGGTVPQ